jgi:hypothetical protein
LGCNTRRHPTFHLSMRVQNVDRYVTRRMQMAHIFETTTQKFRRGSVRALVVWNNTLRMAICCSRQMLYTSNAVNIIHTSQLSYHAFSTRVRSTEHVRLYLVPYTLLCTYVIKIKLIKIMIYRISVDRCGRVSHYPLSTRRNLYRRR